MFVLELSKPSGICLAAEDETGPDRLPGLRPLRRGLAPDERRRHHREPPPRDRIGADRPALRGGRSGGALHARGPGLEPAGDRDVRGLRLPLGRPPPQLLPRQRRGRPDHVAWPASAREPASPESPSDPCGCWLWRRAATTPAPPSIDGGSVLSNVVSSQAAFHEEYGGVVPEVASRHHLQLVNAVTDAALRRGRDAGSSELDAVAVTQGPGLIGALLVGLSTAKAIASARRKPLIPVDHLHGHVAANFLEPEPLEPPFLCLIASGGHTLLRRRARARLLRGAGPDARRRRRRGLRQGGAAARAWAIRAGPRSSGPPTTATPRRSSSRSR